MYIILLHRNSYIYISPRLFLSTRCYFSLGAYLKSRMIPGRADTMAGKRKLYSAYFPQLYSARARTRRRESAHAARLCGEPWHETRAAPRIPKNSDRRYNARERAAHLNAPPPCCSLFGIFRIFKRRARGVITSSVSNKARAELSQCSQWWF